ncbi:MAG: hypothetical protein RLZZ398_2246, partial [Verrucomicrobiota bacterium]
MRRDLAASLRAAKKAGTRAAREQRMKAMRANEPCSHGLLSAGRV